MYILCKEKKYLRNLDRCLIYHQIFRNNKNILLGWKKWHVINNKNIILIKNTCQIYPIFYRCFYLVFDSVLSLFNIFIFY